MRFLPAILVLLLSDVAAAALPKTFTVTNTNTSGAGSLHQAIVDANLTVLADKIEFAIAGGGIKTIGGTLPAITAPVFLDGYTQQGASENTRTDGSTDAVLSIVLDASGVNLLDPMLLLTSSGTTIRGIAIKGIKAKASGIDVAATAVTGVSIRGCFVGTNADGTADQSGGVGITVRGTATIGSADAVDRNLFSGNTTAIDLRGPGSIVMNNLVGTNAAGDAVLGNGIGISVSTAAATGNRIGGVAVGEGNVIAGSTNDGIRLLAAATGDNRIEGNRIHDNGGLGIDIDDNGVTLNDENDTDVGPNHRQNFPVLTFVRYNGASVTVEGYLPSTVGEYHVEFFGNDQVDPSGFGEGEVFLGSVTTVVGDQPDAVEFFKETFELAEEPTAPFFVTATAQSQAFGGTSEFSRAVEAVEGGTEFLVTNNNDSGAGSLRQAIADANAAVGPDTIAFDLTNSTIHPLSGYQIDGTVIVDGYTGVGRNRGAPNTAATGSNARLFVVLDGSLTPEGTAGLELQGPDSILRGLVIHSFPSDGIRGSNIDRLIVEGTFVGTDATGKLDLGNGGIGIALANAVDPLIGGSEPWQRNIVSANSSTGIQHFGTSARILNNIVGADATGLGNLGNHLFGITVVNGAIVGGPDSRSANVVRANLLGGIGVIFGAGNEILVNSTKDNGGPGIDIEPLLAPGISPNDADDEDVGIGNDGQNHPVLTDTSLSPGSLQVAGSLDVPQATVDATYTIRFYASTSCDESGHGEGEFFLGAADVVLSDASEEFLVNLPVDFDENHALTATATEALTGNTSEFSECLGGSLPVSDCGDASGDGEITTSDGLLALRAAVGSGACALCRCDVNSSGGITSTDALLVLRVGVGQQVELDCVECE